MFRRLNSKAVTETGSAPESASFSSEVLSTSGNGLPAHVAIIMDGNGRWAKSRGLPRVAGHKKGAETARAIVECAAKLGVSYLTLYAFSSENWNRPEEEVSELMQLLRYYLGSEIKNLHQQGAKLRVIGNIADLPADIQNQIEQAEQLTASNSKIHINVALSYGGRQEIINAVRLLANKAIKGEISLDEISEKNFERNLYTYGIPDPDLLIRTGGEQRISNFLLWQMAYTELYFTDILWPDFTSNDFKAALDEYQGRERRYGNVA
jgi:undecaprenyl diphosphate synthase